MRQHGGWRDCLLRLRCYMRELAGPGRWVRGGCGAPQASAGVEPGYKLVGGAPRIVAGVSVARISAARGHCQVSYADYDSAGAGRVNVSCRVSGQSKGDGSQRRCRVQADWNVGAQPARVRKSLESRAEAPRVGGSPKRRVRLPPPGPGTGYSCSGSPVPFRLLHFPHTLYYSPVIPSLPPQPRPCAEMCGFFLSAMVCWPPLARSAND